MNVMRVDSLHQFEGMRFNLIQIQIWGFIVSTDLKILTVLIGLIISLLMVPASLQIWSFNGLHLFKKLKV